MTLAAGSLDPWGLAGTVLAAARQAVRVPALGCSQVGRPAAERGGSG